MASNDNEDTLPSTGGVSESVTEVATEVATEASIEASTDGANGQPGEATSDSELQPGDIISARYELVKLLGEGGMGRVFLAIDLLYAREFEDRQSQVAIKFLGLRFASHSVARMALQRETRKSQQLSHPNVVRVLHFDQHEGLPYMIMEYMRGQPLDEFLQDHCREGLPLERALLLIEGMASGLHYIHEQGLVHSDFKPNNVFVGEDGHAKILDLGIARARGDLAEQAEQTRFDASELGAMTPSYASCEMFQGLDPDPRDDVYALACVVYELLTGRHPFDRRPAVRAFAEKAKAERPRGLSTSRWRALQRGLAFTRQERSATARQLAVALAGDAGRGRRLWLTLLLSLLLVGGLAWVGRGYFQQAPDQDALFLDSLTPTVTAPLSEADTERIAGWLEQGRAYREIAGELYAGGDVVEALHVMNDGADNAYRAYANILKRTPSEPAREGVLAMLATYAQWAVQSAADGELADAQLITCHGLRIHPDSARLRQLEQSYRSRLPEGQGVSPPEC